MAEPITSKDFIITRVFDAPRDVVFEMFTDSDHMMRWWGPKDYTVITSKMDARPGGFYHYAMKAPDGSTMWGKFVFREIAEPETLVFIDSFSDEAGNITRHPMSPTWPLELLTTVTFDGQDDKTLLTIRWSLMPSATEDERQAFDAAYDDMNQGWTGTLDRLAAYLATTEEKV